MYIYIYISITDNHTRQFSSTCYFQQIFLSEQLEEEKRGAEPSRESTVTGLNPVVHHFPRAFPWPWGYPNSWMVYNGKSHLKCRIEWGSPTLGHLQMFLGAIPNFQTQMMIFFLGGEDGCSGISE